ncbi:FAD-dependent oxidoreductase [Terasakiella sp. A23]|uniref:FAD-dependent oxidoreductase n=1 Tax=Terasakiella sp. FCG-A23 TaxID=3080561 RepID=UPI002954AF50|nr:FAD-dependent oxidoreductase [Terasakiella sp. A23]MDV7340441.1 FAD-dependent oxidoreductase [Terasakiella sp. A23]
MVELCLSHGLAFEDLYSRDGLQKIDVVFFKLLEQRRPTLYERLMAARAAPDVISRQERSGLLLSLSPIVDEFIADLFQITDVHQQEKADHLAFDAYIECRRKFIQRKAIKAYKADEAVTFDGAALEKQLGGPFDDIVFAQKAMGWLTDEVANADMLEAATKYAAWAYHTKAFPNSKLFWAAGKTDYDLLVETDHAGADGYYNDPVHLDARAGFSLTDSGCDRTEAMAEASYCVHCHERNRDSCSQGLYVKKTEEIDKNPLGVALEGCPLDEMISEMHVAKLGGNFIAAVALACVDNPMMAGTGHRICNDCMTACIYQKQDTVEIPQAETRILKDVLALPWGFEVYSLLTRWNPLNIDRPFVKEHSGRKVLVVGLGPAGYTLAHHLMNDGHQVVAIDGLKIEPLPIEISGVDEAGARHSFQPIHDIKALYEDLNSRTMAGFGGVAEYGITVRWDKNFLKIIRLLLERRPRFTMFGGVRFGGTMTVEDAYQMGFDHIALCAGAGAPTVLDIPNNLAPGVRQASDFLMGLQLGGAAREDTIANLHLRLPVVVVGGGLTAIDACTESLAYYPVQVEKFLKRYETLCESLGEETVKASWTAQESEIAEEFISHAHAIRAEKKKDKPNVLGLLQSWGGAQIAYRRRLQEAPSYRLNADEVTYALKEGIVINELLSPVAVEVDDYGHAAGLRLARQPTGDEITMAAKTIIVAAGTKPNTVLARECPEIGLELDGKYYQALDEEGRVVQPEWTPKPKEAYMLAHIADDGRAISYFGDLHPSFAGNVVSAMASAKRGYPVVSRMMAKLPKNRCDGLRLIKDLNENLRARVVKVIRLTPTIVEIIIKAPAAARKFQPGQFYRLQNFENHALRGPDGTLLSMEGLALTGAHVDERRGLISLIVLEMGGSSNLCTHLKKDEPVILMGPTGAPTEIPDGETVLLAGGGLGNAVLFSIGQAMRARGNRVLYFAAYKTTQDRYHIENIEKAADAIVWCCDQNPGFVPGRDQDFTFVGNVVQAMRAYQDGDLGEVTIGLGEVDRIIAIGSDMMMRAVAQARHDVLKDCFTDHHMAIGSINSPMQCMLKEICAQCLQKHIDPLTGEEKVVFSCFNQDQDLDSVSFDVLRARLSQNSLQEKLTKLWIARSLET